MFVGMFKMLRVGNHFCCQNRSNMLDAHGCHEMHVFRLGANAVHHAGNRLFQPADVKITGF